jgi:hypothetical protein
MKAKTPGLCQAAASKPEFEWSRLIRLSPALATLTACEGLLRRQALRGARRVEPVLRNTHAWQDCYKQKGGSVRRWLLIPIVLTFGLVPALAASAAPTAASMVASGCSGSMVVKTKSYVFALSIGTFQQMYSPAQVKAKHLKSGEVMVRGQMMGMNMAMSGQRHLEVHICSRSSGKVVSGAHPTITVSDLTAKGKMEMMPVAAMYGIKQGPSDYHYGNNIAMTAGHSYHVSVKLGGQTATFKAKAGKM